MSLTRSSLPLLHLHIHLSIRAPRELSLTYPGILPRPPNPLHNRHRRPTLHRKPNPARDNLRLRRHK